MAAGLSKKEAQRDLCGAIMDGKIAVRQHHAADSSRGLQAQIYDGLFNSGRLLPLDIDWRRSRPSPHSRFWTDPTPRPGDPITLFLQQNYHLMGRTVDLIEVKAADVTRIFSTSDSPVDVKAAEGSLKAAPRKSKKILAVWQACDTLWPEGIPEDLSAKERNHLIIDWLRARNPSVPSPRTIERALAQKPRVR